MRTLTPSRRRKDGRRERGSTCSASVEQAPHFPLKLLDGRRAAPPPGLVTLVATRHGGCCAGTDAALQCVWQAISPFRSILLAAHECRRRGVQLSRCWAIAGVASAVLCNSDALPCGARWLHRICLPQVVKLQQA